MSEGLSIGFVGLGAMGGRMARLLLEDGCALAVYDTRPEAVTPLAERGAVPLGSAAEVADVVETVLASLPTPEVVREVACGARGVVHGSAVRTFVDLSTTGAMASEEIGKALAEAGIAHVDAPVSGGVAGLEARRLAVMASGERAAFERVRPLLETFASNVFWVGSEVGQGQTAKLLNNLLSATAVAITSEALALGVRSGLDPSMLLEIFNASTGRNTATTDKFPRHVLTRAFASGFRLRLMAKDVRAVSRRGPAAARADARRGRRPAALDPRRRARKRARRPHPDSPSSTRDGRARCSPARRGRWIPVGDAPLNGRARAGATFEVLAVRYGSLRAPRSELFHRFASYGEPDEVVEMAYYFWILRRDGETIVVDTGFDPAVGERRGRTCLCAPGDALDLLGVDPGSVTTLVVTHLHYDHVGNLDVFPTAELVVPRKELDFWTGPQAARYQFAAHVEPTEVGRLEEARLAGRVRLTDGTEEIVDGVTAIVVGGHSPGQQLTVVAAEAGDVVLTSDAVHFYEELELDRPFGVVADLEAMYSAYDLVKRLGAAPGAIVVPGHDPEVMARFPDVGGQTSGLAVRVGGARAETMSNDERAGGT